MEQQYFKTAGNRIFQKNNKGRGGGGTLDHRVHPERTAVSNNDFNLYAESTKKSEASREKAESSDGYSVVGANDGDLEGGIQVLEKLPRDWKEKLETFIEKYKEYEVE